MGDFNPGEGWRQATWNEDYQHDRHIIVVGEQGEGSTLFVPKKCEPPLPTERDTVIRVNWRPEYALMSDHYFLGLNGWQAQALVIPPEKLRERITGFEVLAEPCEMHYGRADLDKAEERVRHETAKAVIQDLREMSMFTSHVHMSDEVVKTIEHKYGVES